MLFKNGQEGVVKYQNCTGTVNLRQILKFHLIWRILEIKSYEVMLLG